MRIRNALAVVVGYLWVTSCVLTPSYVATRVACAEGDQQFGGLEHDGGAGLTDFSQDISTDTSMRLLAGRRVSFFEQPVTGPAASRWTVPHGATGTKFVRVATVPSTPSECLSGQKNLRFGGLYDLYVYGLQPSECLQAFQVAQPSGRFVLQKEVDSVLGAIVTKHQLVDQTSKVERSTITSAQSRRSPGTYGGAILDGLSPALEARCRADPQSIASAFRASPQGQGNQPLPAVRKLVKAAADRNLRFTRSSQSESSLRAMVERVEPQALVIATKQYRSLVLQGLQFVGHWDLEAWSGCVPTLIPLEDAVLLLSWEGSGLQVSAFGLAGNSRATLAAKVGDGSENLISMGGCGQVQAAALNGRLYVLGYPGGAKDPVSATGVFEADLHDLKLDH